MLLNEQQLAVTRSKARRMAVAACPGSGKTATLVATASSWLDNPAPMAIVTFTRKAVREVRERLRSQIGPAGDRVMVDTFHGMCLRVIREYALDLGYSSRDVMVMDKGDRLTIGREALAGAGVKKWKNMPDEVLERAGSGAAMSKEDIQLVDAYERTIIRENAIDYALMPRLMLRLLDGPNGDDIRARVRLLLVDEYQDADLAQEAVYRAMNPDRMLVVGDPDQILYAWRGATAELFERFIDHEKAEVHRLSVNYRSAGAIVAKANAFRSRIPTAIPRAPMTSMSEANGHAAIVPEHEVVGVGGTEQGQTSAILCRTNFIAKEWSDRLSNEGVPHMLIGRNDKLLDKPEVRLAMAYLSWPVFPYSNVFANRVLIPEGHSTLAIARIREEASIKAVSSFQIAMSISRDLLELYDACEGAGLIGALAGVCDRVRNVALDKEAAKEGLEALMDAACIFLADALPEDRNIRAFASWFCNREAGWDVGDGRIQVMTIHASKGLEFDNVFVVGLEENNFPWKGAACRNLEEERRCFYVAITRAKRWLGVTRPEGAPSMFLEEFA